MKGMRWCVGSLVFGFVGIASVGCSMNAEDEEAVGASEDAVQLTLSADAEDDPVIPCSNGECSGGKVCEAVGDQMLCVTPCDEGPGLPDCKKPSAKCFDGI